MPISDEVGRLKFVARDAERIYLNEERVKDRFTLRFGAIAAWIAKTSKEGGGALGPAFLKVTGKLTGGDEITYDITNPLAQAMLLQTALEDRGEVKSPENADMLEYVAITGTSCAVIPEYPGTGHAEVCMLRPAEEIEAQRADYEQYLKVFEQDSRAWLMVTQIGGARAAYSLLASRWLSDSLRRFMHQTWTTFGILQDHVDGIPVIAPISVLVGKAGRGR